MLWKSKFCFHCELISLSMQEIFFHDSDPIPKTFVAETSPPICVQMYLFKLKLYCSHDMSIYWHFNHDRHGNRCFEKKCNILPKTLILNTSYEKKILEKNIRPRILNFFNAKISTTLMLNFYRSRVYTYYSLYFYEFELNFII